MSDTMLAPAEQLSPQPEPMAPPPAKPLDLSPLLILGVVALLTGLVMHRAHLKYTVNDASRWNTIYYLVQHGTYEWIPLPLEKMPAWASRPMKDGQPVPSDPAEPMSVPVQWTIDMIVAHGKVCSPKPPLLPTMLAGVAWVTQKLSGCTFQEHPLVIVRTILIVGQILPLALCLVLLRRHIFRMTDSPFVRNFSMAAACLGTYLTPWSTTLNNHTIAACMSMVAIDAALRIWYEGRREWYWFALAGFFGTLTAATELPAGLLAAAIMLALLIKDHKFAFATAVVAAAIPTAAFLYTNYLAWGTIVPAYTTKNHVGGFYDYPGSYWNKPLGIDAIHEPKSVYLSHLLVGHDGFFSLTPIFLVSLLGIGAQIGGRGERRLLASFVLLLTAVVVATYVVKTSDYGGGCQGYRWLFWVIPMWLLFLPSGVAWVDRAGGRVILYWLTAISIFSVGFALDHPWTESWIRLLFRSTGVIAY